MTKLEQLHLFLKFHFAPWGAAKGSIWEDEFGDLPYDERSVMMIVKDIMTGDFVIDNDRAQMLSIVANPPAFANNDVELAMRLTKSLAEYDNDPEAAHVTADEFLVSMIESMGHPAVAEAYRAVPKRCS
jgi:hypothetical protein